MEFKEINLAVVSTKADEQAIKSQSPMSVELVKKFNAGLASPETKQILREAVKPGVTGSLVNCEEMIYDGHGGWLGIDWFTSKTTYESCLKVCATHGIDAQHCPCDRLFRRK